MTRGNSALLCTALVLATGLFSAPSSACVDGAGVDDLAIQAQISCARFKDWHFGTYAMTNWDGWGLNTPCDINLPYAKWVNGGMLVVYGFPNEPQRGTSAVFHGHADYLPLTVAAPSVFHHAFHHEPSAGTTLASFVVPLVGKNYVSPHCPLFDQGASWAYPSTRAGDYVHEAWHAWMHKYGVSVKWKEQGTCDGHICGPASLCSSETCDVWSPHDFKDYARGELYNMDVKKPKLIHSPNQIQVEFLCDLVNGGEPWVPFGVKLMARTEANERIRQKFVNDVPITCSLPTIPTLGSPLSGTVRFPSVEEGKPDVRLEIVGKVCKHVTVEVRDAASGSVLRRGLASGRWSSADPTCGYGFIVTPATKVVVRAAYKLREVDGEEVNQLATWAGGRPGRRAIRGEASVVLTEGLAATQDVTLRSVY